MGGHGNEEVAMNDAVGVLLRIKDPHQDIDLAGHALGDVPVRRLIGVDIGQVHQHRGLAQGPASADAHPPVDREPVQQAGGPDGGFRDNGEGLGGGGTDASGLGHLGASQGVGEAGLARAGRAEKGGHGRLRRQASAMRGLRQDLAGLIKAKLLTQRDGLLQAFESSGEIPDVGVGRHRTLLPAGRWVLAVVVRRDVAASWHARSCSRSVSAPGAGTGRASVKHFA